MGNAKKKSGLQRKLSASYPVKVTKPRKLALQKKDQVMNAVDVETC
jgi:hypothetical protein